MARVIAALTLVLLLTTTARAQDDSTVQARALFDQGREAYEAGDYEIALERFSAAHRLTNSPDLLYNIAQCADRLRRDEVALEAYRGYLSGSSESSDRAQVQSRIDVLEAQLARRAHDEEERASREAEARAALDRLRRPDPGPAPWILTGVGAAVLVIGVVLIAVAEVDAACVRQPVGCSGEGGARFWEGDYDGRYDRIVPSQVAGWLGVGVGTVAAASGLVWELIVGDPIADERVSLRLGPGGVHLSGRFD